MLGSHEGWQKEPSEFCSTYRLRPWSQGRNTRPVPGWGIITGLSKYSYKYPNSVISICVRDHRRRRWHLAKPKPKPKSSLTRHDLNPDREDLESPNLGPYTTKGT